MSKKQQTVRTVSVFFVCLFIFSLFLQVDYSKFLWDALSPLWYIQFPWRFLLFSVFTLSFLAGLGLTAIKPKRLQLIYLFVGMALLIGVNHKYFVPQVQLTHVDDSDYVSNDAIRWRTSIMSFEYVPKGIKTKLSRLGNTVVAIDRSQIAKQDYGIVQGQMTVLQTVALPHEKEFIVRSASDGIFRINAFAFPGWSVSVDGKNVVYSDNNDLKLIDIPLTSGNHMVRAKFQDTPLRMVSNSISFISLVFVLSYGLWRGKQKIAKRS